MQNSDTVIASPATRTRSSPPATRTRSRTEKRLCTGLEQSENPGGSICIEPTVHSPQIKRRGRPKKVPAEEADHPESSKGKGIEEGAGSGDEGRSSPTRPQQEPPNSEGIYSEKEYENAIAGYKIRYCPSRPQQKAPNSEETLPKLWKIRVQHGGRLYENEKGNIEYCKSRDNPADAYIHQVNPLTFRFFDLCHAVLGKLSGPKPQRLMWYKTKPREDIHIQDWSPIGCDADVKNMFKVSMSWTERIAMVMTQQDAVRYKGKGGVSSLTYKIPKSVPMLPQDTLVSWEKIEQKIAAKEAELRIGHGENLERLGMLQMQGKEWFVSYKSVPYPKSKYVKNGYDAGFFCDSYINKI